MRACFLPEIVSKEVKGIISPDVRRQVYLLWEHRVWDRMDITRGKWPTDDAHETGSVPEGSVQALDPLNHGDRLEGYSESEESVDSEDETD